MSDYKNTLKNAFTDAFYENPPEKNHAFSIEFEEEMQSLIKRENKTARLLNTVSRHVAVIIIALVLSVITFTFSVKAIREPIVKEIKKVFINVRELLLGTEAEDIAELFPSEVTKIVGTDFTVEGQKQHIIDDGVRIKSFISLISESSWTVNETRNTSDGISVYWTFDFYGGDGTVLLQAVMCNEESGGSPIGGADVIIKQNGRETAYRIGYDTYLELLAFTNEKFYLHGSVLPIPDKAFLQDKQYTVEKGLNDDELKAVEKYIRRAHYATEVLLLNNFSLLKDGDSLYWQYFLSGEAFTDPITGKENRYYYSRYDGSIYRGVCEDLRSIYLTVQDNETREIIKYTLDLWKKSAESRDLEGLFKVHEYLHDYDYFVINYPVHYVYDSEADYQGTGDYFGHIPIE